MALVLRGVPGLYFHGIIGTENDPAVVEASGHNRDINRLPIHVENLLQQLEQPESKLDQIRTDLGKLGTTRVSHKASCTGSDYATTKLWPDSNTTTGTMTGGRSCLDGKSCQCN
jgi:hypothetical protein